MEVENVKMLRIKYNKTQEEMSMILNCSIPTYIKKEKGDSDFTRCEIIILIKEFNLSMIDVWNIFFKHKLNKNEIKQVK